MIFRELSQKEEQEFRDWARTEYEPGSPVNPMWHPVVHDEIAKLGREQNADTDSE